MTLNIGFQFSHGVGASFFWRFGGGLNLGLNQKDEPLSIGIDFVAFVLWALLAAYGNRLKSPDNKESVA